MVDQIIKYFFPKSTNNAEELQTPSNSITPSIMQNLSNNSSSNIIVPIFTSNIQKDSNYDYELIGIKEGDDTKTIQRKLRACRFKYKDVIENLSANPHFIKPLVENVGYKFLLEMHNGYAEYGYIWRLSILIASDNGVEKLNKLKQHFGEDKLFSGHSKHEVLIANVLFNTQRINSDLIDICIANFNKDKFISSECIHQLVSLTTEQLQGLLQEFKQNKDDLLNNYEGLKVIITAYKKNKLSQITDNDMKILLNGNVSDHHIYNIKAKLELNRNL